MSIDYYICKHCGEAFPDVDDYVCCDWGEHWCSLECAIKDRYIDEHYKFISKSIREDNYGSLNQYNWVKEK